MSIEVGPLATVKKSAGAVALPIYARGVFGDDKRGTEARWKIHGRVGATECYVEPNPDTARIGH
jgi:hypothetical protein